MNADYGAEIKDTLNAYQVFTRYGFRINKGGFVRCPFHSGGNERTASLKLYDGRKGWHCHACGRGGSVIDFVMQYFDLPFKEACKKMDEDFSLGLNIGGELSEEERKKISRQAYELRKKRKAYENRRKMLYTAYYAALDKYTALDSLLSKSRADGEETPITSEVAYAMKHIAEAKYNLDEAEDALRRFEAEEKAV